MRWLLWTILLTACAHTLTFIDDDYGKAVAQARASKKPIFVETWAPW